MPAFLKYLPYVLVSLLTVRMCAFGGTFGEAFAIFAISAFVGYKEYLATRIVKDPTEELKEEMKKLRNEFTTLSLGASQRPKATNATHRF